MPDHTFRGLSINTYFDRIFYINLEKDTERNRRMREQFSKYGITNYERINAITLRELPDKKYYRNFINADHKYILGALSCRASHVACIKTASERNYSNILVLEDDIVFLQDPNALLRHNSRVLQEWDMLYFGGLIEPRFRNQVVCAHAYAVNSRVYDDIICMADASGTEIDNFYAK